MLDRERQPSDSTRVQISRAVFDGLEFVRQSGATNMLDRTMVLNLAREWGFTETADWVESADTKTYGRLIFQGPEVVEDEQTGREIATDLDHPDPEGNPSHHVDEREAMTKTNDPDEIDFALDTLRSDMHELIIALGKHAILTIADTYQTEQMGVPLDRSHRDLIMRERQALIRNLGQASSVWLQLESVLIEAQRGIGSLQYLIHPENN